MTIPKQIQLLTGGFETESVNYCVWKGAHKLADAMIGKEDIDILIDRKCSATAATCLSRAGFFEVRKPWYRSDIGLSDYFGFESPSGLLHIHLHTQTVFGNALARDYHYPFESVVLKNRVWNEEFGFWTASAADDLHMFTIRHLLRKRLGKGVSLEPELSQLVERLEHDRTENLDREFPIHILGELLQNRSDASDFADLRRRTRSAMAPFKIRGKTAGRALSFQILSGYALKRQIERQPTTTNRIANGGIIVPFVGIDGSGKSSALDRLASELSSIVPVTRVSLGSGQSGAGIVRRTIFRFAGTKARLPGHSNARSSAREGSSTASYPWYYKFWLYLCIRDKQSQFRRALSSASQGEIVLVDRWLQTEFSGSNDGPRTLTMQQNNWFDRHLVAKERRVYENLDSLEVPLVVLLDVTPETSVERKPDDLTLIQARQARLRLLRVRWNARSVATIDADLPMPDVDHLVISAISECLQHGHHD